MQSLNEIMTKSTRENLHFHESNFSRKEISR